MEHWDYMGYKLILAKLWQMKKKIQKFRSKICLVLMQSTSVLQSVHYLSHRLKDGYFINTFILVT